MTRWHDRFRLMRFFSNINTHFTSDAFQCKPASIGEIALVAVSCCAMTLPPDTKLKPPCFYGDAVMCLPRFGRPATWLILQGAVYATRCLGLPPKITMWPPTLRRKRCARLFSNTQAVGAAFGVILVRIGQSVVEVATFRSDGNIATAAGLIRCDSPPPRKTHSGAISPSMACFSIRLKTK